MGLSARVAPALLMVAAACAGRTRTTASVFQPSVADSVHTERLAPGVTLHRLVQIHAPWRAYVLDVDLTACASVRSVKGGPVASGRRTTSALLASIPAEEKPLAAVNADFFLFAPAGVPVGAHVENGKLLSGPSAGAAFGMTAARTPWMGRLSASATVRTSHGDVALRTWNRPTRKVPGLVDAAWGVALDSTITSTVYRLAPVAPSTAEYTIDTLSSTDSRVARGDTLLVVELPAGALRIGERVGVSTALDVPNLMTVVGGRPVMMRDSVLLGAVDSIGDAGFRGLNPRTALGVANGGKRLFLVVIDGRQAGYSMGMSVRETATLLRDMGARDAINLDGGGSSAMVVRDARAPGMQRIVNKPSDAVGERPVANALAVTGVCGAR